MSKRDCSLCCLQDSLQIKRHTGGKRRAEKAVADGPGAQCAERGQTETNAI